MSKLTLSVDEAVVNRAKRYAKARGTSISKLVETYLSSVSEPASSRTANTPVLRSVRGLLKSADVKDYKQYIEKKYR